MKRESQKISRPLMIGLIVVGATIGTAAGLGAYTFLYAKGGSYMTNDPRACVNCHVMDQQYRAWEHSSHRTAAVCNDCHAPHDFFGKYMTKAINGWNHSAAFTTGNFHEPIQITERNRKITEQACRDCHAPIVSAIDSHAAGAGKTERLDCLRCHQSVGHMH